MAHDLEVQKKIDINKISCCLKITADKLKAFVSFSNLDKLSSEECYAINWNDFEEELCSWLEQFLDVDLVDDRSLKSSLDILRSTLEKLQNKSTKDTKILERKIASGIPPSIPRDGKYILLVKPFTEITNEGYDFSTKFQKKFDNVFPETVVIRVYPPKSGDPGKEVTGLVIPPLSGKEALLNIGTGLENRLVDGKNYIEVVAKKDGFLKIDNLNNAFISDILEVKSDLDHKTGSVEFSGSVVIKGTVRPGFLVKCINNIEVLGDVLDSNIYSQNGSIKIKGKILGTDMLSGFSSDKYHEDDFNRIESGSDFSCDEIQSYAVFSKGNINISKNASRSILSCSGGIFIEKSILSSRLRTVCGIQVGTLGNETEVTNLIEILSVTEASREYLILKEKLDKLKEQEGILNTFLGPYAIDHSLIKKLSNIHRSKLELSLKKLIDTTKEISNTMSEIEKLTKDNKNTKSSNINILKEAYPGSIIRAESNEYKIHSLLKGPFTISYSFETKQFTKQDLLPLECNF